MHCKGSVRPDRFGNIACKSDAGNFQSLAAARNFTDSFAHKRRLINAAFACDDQISTAQLLIQSREASKQIEARLRFGAQKCRQTETKPTGCACTGALLEFRLEASRTG